MHRYDFPTAFLRDIAACLLATALTAVFAFATFGIEFGSAEEGPLETAQEWLLVLTTAFLVAAALRQPMGAPRLASMAGAVLSAVFFFRELEPVGDGPVATYLQSGAFRLHEAIVVAVLAIVAAPRGLRFAPEILKWLASRSVWPLALAGLVLLAADAIDGRHALWGVEWLPRAIEETMETFAYAVILACAVRWHAIARANAARD